MNVRTRSQSRKKNLKRKNNSTNLDDFSTNLDKRRKNKIVQKNKEIKDKSQNKAGKINIEKIKNNKRIVKDIVESGSVINDDDFIKEKELKMSENKINETENILHTSIKKTSCKIIDDDEDEDQEKLEAIKEFPKANCNQQQSEIVKDQQIEPFNQKLSNSTIKKQATPERKKILESSYYKNKRNTQIFQTYNNLKNVEEKIENIDDSVDSTYSEMENLNINLSTQLAQLDNLDLTEKLTNSTIYCREKEKEIILNFITSQDTTCKTLFVCGQPGTGKTSTILEIFESLEKTSKDSSHSTSNSNNITYFKMYLNCMSVHSIDDFYFEFFSFFNKIQNLHRLKRILTKNEYHKTSEFLKLNPNKKNLFTFLENLESHQEKLKPLILLDEVDYFYQKNNEILFYDILNIPNLASSSLKILMISNNSDFDKEILPKIKNRKIKIEKCVFEPYTHIEINRIISKKLEEMGMSQNFEENAIRFLSGKLANKSGDLRPALELIKKIILDFKDDFQNNKKKIELIDVISIMKLRHSHFVEIIKNLTFEQKLVVISIYFLINKLDSIELEESSILEQYKIIKKEYFNNNVNNTEFREIVKSLCDMGIMEEKVKTPMKTRARFKIKPKMEDIQILFGEEEKFFSMFQPIIN